MVGSSQEHGVGELQQLGLIDIITLYKHSIYDVDCRV